MFLGRVLAEAACAEGKCVTWLPSYGAEVRGGTANCMVTISSLEIGSPFIDKADALIILNEPSMAKFKDRLKAHGLLVVNASLVPQASAVGAVMEKHAFTDKALSLGSAKVANMLALGCFVAASKVLKTSSILNALKAMVSQDRPELARLNTEAFLRGIKLVQHKDKKRGIDNGPR